jgi:hypothetical protein
MDLTASEASSVMSFGSDAEMPEDPIEEPVYLGRKREKFFKMIIERGENIDKPGTLDEVTLRFCDFSENLNDFDFKTVRLGLGLLPDYLEKGLTSMKKNEIADLHVPEAMTKSEAKIIRIELQSFFNIHDLHANGMMLKKVLNKSSEIDRISYKDEVKFRLKVTQGSQVLQEEILDLIVGVSKCSEGIVEILKTMKKYEFSQVTVKNEYFSRKFDEKILGFDDVMVEIEILSHVKLTDVYVNGGFFKKVLDEGVGLNPYPNSQVEIEYSLTSADKNTSGRLTAYIDECSIPSLWQDTIKLMKLNEHCRVECFPNEKSTTLRDSFNTDLNCKSDEATLHLKLLQILSGGPLYDLEEEDKLHVAKRMKTVGSDLFKISNFSRAIEKYELGLAALNPVKDNLEMFLETYVSLQLNIALSFSKLKDFRSSVIRCDRVLEVSPEELKVLFRKGSSQKSMFEYQAAIQVFEAGLEIARNKKNEAVKDFLKEIAECKSCIENYHKKEKKLYANLFK